jgi:hypothetical protein
MNISNAGNQYHRPLGAVPPGPPRNDDDGCLKSCLKGFCDLVKKVCNAVVSAFRYIFCCQCLRNDGPAPGGPNLPTITVTVDPLPPINKGDLKTFPAPPPEEPNLNNPIAQEAMINMYFLSTMDNESLEAIGGGSNDRVEIGIINEALRRRKANAPIKYFNATPPNNQGPGVGKGQNIRPPPPSEIPLRPPATDVIVVDEQEQFQECPAAPAPPPKNITHVRYITDKPELIRLIKEGIENNSNWRFNYDTSREVNIPVIFMEGELGETNNIIKQIQDNCNNLTQDDWIQLLNEIQSTNRPDPIIPLSESHYNLNLDESSIKNAFRDDSEVVLKQRLAALAGIWIEHRIGPLALDMYGIKQRCTALNFDRSHDHPFHAIYHDMENQPIDGQVEYTLIAFQELIRFLPLIKEFARQKKKILVQHQGLQERSFDVNYLLDSVLDISQNLTGLIVHNQSGPSHMNETGSTRTKQINMKELDSDKIVRGVDTLWNTYLKAKAKKDLPGFGRAFGGYCFDARISSLNTFGAELVGSNSHPDLILNSTELNKGTRERVVEYFRVFLNEQLAIFCHRQEPKLKYSEFKNAVHTRQGTPSAKLDPQHMDFFTNYATEARFKAWAQLIQKHELDQYGCPLYPSITDKDWRDGKDRWAETLQTLEAYSLTFDP